MPATICNECGQAHAYSYRIQQAGPKCVYHDRDNRVAKGLKGHQGLPTDCPGCLAWGSIEKRSYGRRDGDFQLTCQKCGTTYYWSEP
jgi:RNase P subunit RPR2